MNEEKNFDPFIVVYSHHTFVHLFLVLLDNQYSPHHQRTTMRSPSVHDNHEMNSNLNQVNKQIL